MVIGNCSIRTQYLRTQSPGTIQVISAHDNDNIYTSGLVLRRCASDDASVFLLKTQQVVYPPWGSTIVKHVPSKKTLFTVFQSLSEVKQKLNFSPSALKLIIILHLKMKLPMSTE